MAPTHGFARLAPWRLVGVEETAGTVITLALRLTDEDVAEIHAYQAWPHASSSTVPSRSQRSCRWP